MISRHMNVLSKLRSLSTLRRGYGTYTRALVRSIDDSLAAQALRSAVPQHDVNLAIARDQHKRYIDVLKSLNILVHELPSDNYPDSVFIEDTMVAIDDMVVVTNPGANSRRGERHRVIYTMLDDPVLAPVIKQFYKIKELGDGMLDGGDVMFTGKEIFVGLSRRTNAEGIMSLKMIFSNHYPVHTINLASLNINSTLHLKSLCSMAGPSHMLLGGPHASVLLAEFMKYTSSSSSSSPASLSQMKYTILPDEAMANCLYINGTIVRRCDDEYSNSIDAFKHGLLKDVPQIQVANSELEKVDGALTCCSVLMKY